MSKELITVLARGFRLPFGVVLGIAGYVYAAENSSNGWLFWALYFGVFPFVLATVWLEGLAFFQSVSSWRNRSRRTAS